MSSIDALVSHRYKAAEAEEAIEALSQGERDILERVREALGWPSIKSLVVKYFPHFKHRKWWSEAIRRTSKYARRFNIRYLLRCLESIKDEWQQSAYTPKGNRLTSASLPPKTIPSPMDDNRCSRKGGFVNIDPEQLSQLNLSWLKGSEAAF